MIWLLLICFVPGGFNQETTLSDVFDNVFISTSVCEDDYNITAVYNGPLPERKNQYNLYIPVPQRGRHNMIVKFDSEASLETKIDSSFRVSKLIRPRNSFIFNFDEDYPYKGLNVQVFGPARTGTIPYVLSIVLDNREICKVPRTGYFDVLISDESEERSLNQGRKHNDESCGRRKVMHTELIHHGQQTKSGDWPWHVAILQKEGSNLMYICGGTLLSKTLVLTAAHCASTRGNAVVPESLSVSLGKYNLFGGDIAPQERGVFEIIIHPKFNASTVNNDIALLKLKSEAVFNNYIQPACLWHSDDNIPTKDVFGTVVGWGFNQQNEPSATLQQITIPIISDLDCLKRNPIFYQKQLNINKFCAGFANGTSVCNGDSGGGLMVFEPDTPGDTSQSSGSWYVRGIVSLTRSKPNTYLCDPEQYTIFTDVVQYRDWLLEYLN